MSSVIEAQIEFKEQCKILRHEISSAVFSVGQHYRETGESFKEKQLFHFYIELGTMPDERLAIYSHWDYRDIK